MSEKIGRGAQTPRPARNRTLLAGVIIYARPAFTMDCAVRNLSEGGAHVRVAGLPVLMDPIALLVPRLDSAHEAVVAWQKGREFGVRFTRQIDLGSPVSDLDKIVRRLWLERSAR